MNHKISLPLLLCLFLLAGELSLAAKESPVTKRDIKALSKKIDSVDAQHKSAIADVKAELAALRKELEAVKNQKCSVPADVTGSLADFKAIAHTLIKYGNNPEGISALHYAIIQGDANAVNLLLAYGADVTTKDGDFSPLTRAASWNQFEIAQILLNAGANVNHILKEDSYYPLYYAAQSGSANLINLFIEHGAKRDRVNENNTSRYPVTPLHVACAAGNYEAVVALVESGAKVDGVILGLIKEPAGLRWSDGTPLDWAICKLTYADNPQNLELIKFMVENGATRRVHHLYDHGAHDYKCCPVINQYLYSVGLPQF